MISILSFADRNIFLMLDIYADGPIYFSPKVQNYLPSCTHKNTYSKLVAHCTQGILPVFQVEDLQCGVPGLEPGHRYMFRVKAVNEEGESEPLVTEKETLAKDPWGNILAFEIYMSKVYFVFLYL